jgi:hypothetical protein
MEGNMDTHASIEAVLDKAYEARRAEDVEAVIACFHEDGASCRTAHLR